jgi:signal transduction histidine kinase
MGNRKLTNGNLYSIRTRLILSFILIILLLAGFIFSIIAVHFYVIGRYQAIINNLALEQSITNATPELIQSYNNLVKNIDNEERFIHYQKTKKGIEDIFTKLDPVITSSDSRVVYKGVKTLALSIIDDCDSGIMDVQRGNLLSYSKYYDDASKKYFYLKEDSARLVSTEVEYANIVRQRLDELERLISIAGIISLILIFSTCIGLAFVLSKRMTRPLFRLSGVAARISEGNLDVDVDQDLLRRKDEVGSLSLAFSRMLSNLKKKIIEEEHARKLAERANIELKDLDIKKDEFTSVAAHELKTPLASIKGFAQLMQNDVIMHDRKKRAHYLKLIDENTVRLNNLVVDLVDSSRLSLGKLKLELSVVDTHKVFTEIRSNMEMIIKEKGVRPVFRIEKDIPKMRSDKERVLQVLRNLLVNAIHFTEHGEISLVISRKGRFVQFAVRDTGEGIPKDKQKDIFTKFYQANQSATRKVQGSGLGLSICKGLVELMGGTIWFESVEGKGSTFYFTIPAA